MAISKVTKDLRRLLDAQNIPWEDHSTDSIERTWIPLDDGTTFCCMCGHYVLTGGVEYGLTLGFPSKLDASIINSVDDYAFTTPKTPEEVLEVLGRHGEK
jgi:hypothetical protein